ncbi:unnamed protein product [Vitrella brassicaformis CCMP3155]|uniref:Uncharacterized protein n=2 Tax=Vitrella brassicaformis TaxID=1169539 RepID=A0A0G4FJI5_VITBC|nr:unnamed protein product [Vitrella brassicaformis CCMP3155]|eukprot:CEM13906.1 unnamed protein product [Vitrella brassicaformis CCMP3155]
MAAERESIKSCRESFVTTLFKEELPSLLEWHKWRSELEQRRFLGMLDSLLTVHGAIQRGEEQAETRAEAASVPGSPKKDNALTKTLTKAPPQTKSTPSLHRRTKTFPPPHAGMTVQRQAAVPAHSSPASLHQEKGHLPSIGARSLPDERRPGRQARSEDSYAVPPVRLFLDKKLRSHRRPKSKRKGAPSSGAAETEITTSSQYSNTLNAWLNHHYPPRHFLSSQHAPTEAESSESTSDARTFDCMSETPPDSFAGNMWVSMSRAHFKFHKRAFANNDRFEKIYRKLAPVAMKQSVPWDVGVGYPPDRRFVTSYEKQIDDTFEAGAIPRPPSQVTFVDVVAQAHHGLVQRWLDKCDRHSREHFKQVVAAVRCMKKSKEGPMTAFKDEYTDQPALARLFGATPTIGHTINKRRHLWSSVPLAPVMDADSFYRALSEGNRAKRKEGGAQ